MAGIKANSQTQTMVDGDTAEDQNVSGYNAGEQVNLTLTGSPSSHVWTIAKPAGATARSDLATTTSATTRFTPDVSGYWVVTCNIGTAEYVLRIAVVAIATETVREAMRFTPLADSAVVAPSSGAALFWSADSGALKMRLADNSLLTVTTS